MHELFKHRRSVRAYTSQMVEPEKIDHMLHAAMSAPSAQNGQPWEFVVVTNQALLEKLAACSPYSKHVKDAPLAIVPCYRKELKRPDFVLIDMGICSNNILLEAVAQGLGAVFVGIAPMSDRMENVRRVLDLSDHLEPFAIIPCGYPEGEQKEKDCFDSSRIHYME